MKIYLDTSSLVKLYYKEADSNIIESIIAENKTENQQIEFTKF